MDMDTALKAAVAEMQDHMDVQLRLTALENRKAFDVILRAQHRTTNTLMDKVDLLQEQVTRLSALVKESVETSKVVEAKEGGPSSSSNTPTVSDAKDDDEDDVELTKIGISKLDINKASSAQDKWGASLNSDFLNRPAQAKTSASQPTKQGASVSGAKGKTESEKPKDGGKPGDEQTGSSANGAAAGHPNPPAGYKFPELDNIVLMVGLYGGMPHELQTWSSKVDSLWCAHDFDDDDPRDEAYKRALLKALPKTFYGLVSDWYIFRGERLLKDCHWQDWKNVLKQMFGGTFDSEFGVRSKWDPSP